MFRNEGPQWACDQRSSFKCRSNLVGPFPRDADRRGDYQRTAAPVALYGYRGRYASRWCGEDKDARADGWGAFSPGSIHNVKNSIATRVAAAVGFHSGDDMRKFLADRVWVPGPLRVLVGQSSAVSPVNRRSRTSSRCSRSSNCAPSKRRVCRLGFAIVRSPARLGTYA